MPIGSAKRQGGTISVGIDPGQRAYLEQTLSAVAGGAKRAIVSAINRTLSHARTNVSKRIREVLDLKKSEVDDRIKIASKPQGDDFSGSIRISYEPVPLSRFPHSVTKRGVFVSIFKGQTRQRFRRMFSPAKFKTLFERKGKERMPIKKAFGPAVVTAFDLTPNLSDQALADIAEFLHKTLVSKIEWQLAKATQDSEAAA